MPLATDSLSVNAMGGTELLKHELQRRIDPKLLDQFQIFVSRAEQAFDETKIRLFWAHDLPGDPASEHLKNGGWANYHKLIFVSNWQMQAYIQRYGIPWSHCIVVQNAINPLEEAPQDTNGTIRLGYWSTPHRGLNILIPVFDRLCQKYDNIELDVYSSFKLYGWDRNDEPYKPLFDMCETHPKINYYGTIDNTTLRSRISQMHIMAYPSIWHETSCLCLMEAMSAGLLCVHPNLGALSETAANWTNMYQWNEDLNQHASQFYNALDVSIETRFEDAVVNRLSSQRSYTNVFYNWDGRQSQWEHLLGSLIDLPRELPSTANSDVYVFDTNS